MKGRQRSQKWYLANEKEVMEDLGLKATPGSGSSWIAREDGENEYVLAQLKSTDKQSYTLKQLDLDKLEHNATVSKKIPLFVIQFLNNDSRYALMNIDDIPLIAEYIKTGSIKNIPDVPTINLDEPVKKVKKPKIKSSSNAREQFFKEKQQAFENRKYDKK